jgi:type IV fimbrial biogenesis protein FimT
MSSIIDDNRLPMPSLNHSAPRAIGGFTLIELMVAVALLAVGLALGVPYIRDAVMGVRMTGQANDFMADLALARSEAVKRNVRVALCTSTDGTICGGSTWADGWIVFADLNGSGTQDAGTEGALKSRGKLEGDNTVQVCGDVGSGPRYLSYRPSGTSGAGLVNFVICDTRTTNLNGRSIDITNTGRANVTRVTCPFTPDCTP